MSRFYIYNSCDMKPRKNMRSTLHIHTNIHIGLFYTSLLIRTGLLCFPLFICVGRFNTSRFMCTIFLIRRPCTNMRSTWYRNRNIHVYMHTEKCRARIEICINICTDISMCACFYTRATFSCVHIYICIWPYIYIYMNIAFHTGYLCALKYNI